MYVQATFPFIFDIEMLVQDPTMYECCLASQTERNEDGSPLEFSRAVNLDRLCSLLIDVNRWDDDVSDILLRLISHIYVLEGDQHEASHSHVLYRFVDGAL